MQHLSALEYAQWRRTEGLPWAAEILEALEFEDSQELETLRKSRDEFLELVPEDIRDCDPWRIAEWINDRLAMLERIQEHLANAGLNVKDADDTVEDLINTLDL